MTVLNFSYATIKNAEKFQQYLEAAAALMEGADVEVIVRGEFSKTMAGDHTAPHIVAVFRYSDMAAAENIYTSAQYKALIPLRDEACDMTINLYEE